MVTPVAGCLGNGLHGCFPCPWADPDAVNHPGTQSACVNGHSLNHQAGLDPALMVCVQLLQIWKGKPPGAQEPLSLIGQETSGFAPMHPNHSSGSRASDAFARLTMLLGTLSQSLQVHVSDQQHSLYTRSIIFAMRF